MGSTVLLKCTLVFYDTMDEDQREFGMQKLISSTSWYLLSAHLLEGLSVRRPCTVRSALWRLPSLGAK